MPEAGGGRGEPRINSIPEEVKGKIEGALISQQLDQYAQALVQAVWSLAIARARLARPHDPEEGDELSRAVTKAEGRIQEELDRLLYYQERLIT